MRSESIGEKDRKQYYARSFDAILLIHLDFGLFEHLEYFVLYLRAVLVFLRCFREDSIGLTEVHSQSA